MSVSMSVLHRVNFILLGINLTRKFMFCKAMLYKQKIQEKFLDFLGSKIILFRNYGEVSFH